MTHRQRTDWQISERRGFWLGYVEKVRGLSKKKTHSTDNGMEITRGRGGGGVEEGRQAIKGNSDGRRLDLGWQTHSAIYRGRIVELYT